MRMSGCGWADVDEWLRVSGWEWADKDERIRMRQSGWGWADEDEWMNGWVDERVNGRGWADVDEWNRGVVRRWGCRAVKMCQAVRMLGQSLPSDPTGATAPDPHYWFAGPQCSGHVNTYESFTEIPQWNIIQASLMLAHCTNSNRYQPLH